MTPPPAAPRTTPSDTAPSDIELAAAAERLVAAFATGDLDAYFASFAPDATFVFHSTAEVLTSVAAYRALWARWVAEDGFTVLACTSSEQHWQEEGGSAVLVHRVATTTRAGGVVSSTDERESIVFTRREGRWLAVHEHLSEHPAAGADA
ncbi:YybH family protein [Kineococcus rubinsiae]|uniref:YybH family protein n=1 Tax=Kineococcus rubinsiae TaxID=2609562 RepID=UPI00142FE9D7|nr:nuclear transport factor 2 family protein [Kineococcus rubinsiae]NIZ90140.1 nuclear transport factor 2 family protein [Kineococcus rubinsiae]